MTEYSHFEKSIPCGQDGMAVGAKGSEVSISDGSGNIAHGGSTIAASAAEIDRAADKSASIISATADVTLTMASHDGKTIVMNKASGGVTVTLPAATGSGFSCTLLAGSTLTSGNYIAKVANATDVMDGSKAYGVDDDGEGATGYQWMAEAGDDTITLNGAATGGIEGDTIEILDYASGKFSCTAKLIQGGGSEATPFTATVA